MHNLDNEDCLLKKLFGHIVQNDETLEYMHKNSQKIGIRLLLWRRKWQPTPVLLPGKSHGWRSLVGCSLWDR